MPNPIQMTGLQKRSFYNIVVRDLVEVSKTFLFVDEVNSVDWKNYNLRIVIRKSLQLTHQLAITSIYKS